MKLLLPKACLSLGLVVFVLIVGCGRDELHTRSSVLSSIDERGTIRVGYIVFPPTIVKDPDTGKLSGHFVATIEEIARQADWEIEYTETEWATFSAGLQSQKFDLSIAPTFVTVPRAKSVAFTQPLFYAGNSAIVAQGDDRFSDLESLDQPGVTIAVTQGEAGHEFANQHFDRAEILVHSGGDQSLTFQTVVSGRADIALGDSYMTSQFAAANPDKVRDLFANNPYNLTPVSWAVRNQDLIFLKFINDSLRSLEVQGMLGKFEEEAGADWLHRKVEWVKN